ncbi:hypothetical protein F9C11_17745 [Amycolatopsis sp. VS8301801F10]|uniref:hypothetical protein n=1 Tax=Amycolatopsis sp. VS8301801F10 TaxID=2652442 RepID=UPI0038FCA681
MGSAVAFAEVRKTRLVRALTTCSKALHGVHGCRLFQHSYPDDEDIDLDETEIAKLNERLAAQLADAVRTEAAANPESADKTADAV